MAGACVNADARSWVQTKRAGLLRPARRQLVRDRGTVRYGSEVPEFAFTCEISLALMSPLAFTSRRKFAPVSGWPD